MDDVTEQDIIDRWGFGVGTIEKMRSGFRPQRTIPFMPPVTFVGSDVTPDKKKYPVIEYRMDVEWIGQKRREFVVGYCGDVECRVWQGPLV